MKTFRPYFNIIILPVLMLSITACQTKRTLNRQKSEKSFREEQQFGHRREENGLKQVSRLIHLKDSSESGYQLSIIPLDTFYFTPQGGVKVKASYVEVKGMQNRVLTLADSSMQRIQRQSAEQISMETSRIQHELSDLVMKEKAKQRVIHLIGWLLILIIVAIVIWRFRRRFVNF